MLRRFGEFLREVRAEWVADDALSLGAALAYYTVFSMAPLLVLVIAIAGVVLGRAAAEGELVGQIGNLVGQAGAEESQAMDTRGSGPKAGVVAVQVGIVSLWSGNASR